MLIGGSPRIGELTGIRFPIDENLANESPDTSSDLSLIGGKYLGRERVDWLSVDRIRAAIARPAVSGKAAWG